MIEDSKDYTIRVLRENNSSWAEISERQDHLIMYLKSSLFISVIINIVTVGIIMFEVVSKLWV